MPVGVRYTRSIHYGRDFNAKTSLSEGGYNAMLHKQQKEDGGAIITTMLFDDHYEIIHDRTNLKEIKLLTEEEYFVGGSTALLDAVGITIDKQKEKYHWEFIFLGE